MESIIAPIKTFLFKNIFGICSPIVPQYCLKINALLYLEKNRPKIKSYYSIVSSKKQPDFAFYLPPQNPLLGCI
jgi:hypothetical protein